MARGNGSPPDGIRPEHWREAGGPGPYAGVLALAVLTALVLAGVLGAFGAPDETRAVETAGARLEVHGPRLIRNGEFFEMRFRAEAKRPIREMVVAVDDAIWEDITVNTMIPAATEETHEDGAFRFTFGRVPPGSAFLFKVDAQINPDFRGENAGTVRLLDGERLLAETPYTLTVLP